ncbi:hypothetical protein J6590_057886 [Homalodisca vitripennis]|nr:hypothetical protein J6590_057886 [Homalodisca vitripennis]
MPLQFSQIAYGYPRTDERQGIQRFRIPICRCGCKGARQQNPTVTDRQLQLLSRKADFMVFLSLYEESRLSVAVALLSVPSTSYYNGSIPYSITCQIVQRDLTPEKYRSEMPLATSDDFAGPQVKKKKNLSRLYPNSSPDHEARLSDNEITSTSLRRADKRVNRSLVISSGSVEIKITSLSPVV